MRHHAKHSLRISRRQYLALTAASAAAVAGPPFLGALNELPRGLRAHAATARRPIIAATKRLPRDNLLLYRDENSQVLPVKSPEDWQIRRAEIVRGMESVMGSLPGDERRCDFDPQLVEEVDGGSYVRRLLTITSEPGCRLPVYLCIPKQALSGKTQAKGVLCLHGTDDKVGHAIVVGIGRANRQYATELAERGYVTIAPNYPILAKYRPDLRALGWVSGTLKAVWDNMRCLDYLETLGFVAAGRFGAIGHSLGGHNSVYTSVFDQRIAGVVSSCGLDSYLDYYDGNEGNWFTEKGWCQTRYMIRLAEYRGRLEEIPFDFHEMIGALAPRPVLIIAPLKDSNFRAESVDRVAKAARDVYRLLGHSERLQVVHPDCEHDFPQEMRNLGYEFLDSALN